MPPCGEGALGSFSKAAASLSCLVLSDSEDAQAVPGLRQLLVAPENVLLHIHLVNSKFVA